MRRRISCGAIVLLFAFVPVLLSCVTIHALLPGDDSRPSASATPNPAKVPAQMLGPADLLVAVDPWFAGTLVFWIVPWLLVIVGFTILATAIVQPTHSKDQFLRIRRPSTLLAISLVLGIVLALPWIYGVIRLLASS